MGAQHPDVLSRAVLPSSVRVEGPPSFDDVYDAHVDFVWRSARALGVPGHALDDVTQEIFLVVHRRLVDFEGRSSVRTWLYGILRNVVRAHRRRAPEREGADPEELPDAKERAPDEAAANAEAARLVLRFLEALDDDKREVFVLAELEQLSTPEIASMLGEKPNTISSRLRLARERFAVVVDRHRQHDEWRLR